MLIFILGVEETKRQRSGTWLYRRKQDDTHTPDQTSETPPGKPIIHTSQPGDEKIPLGNLNHAAQPNPYAQGGENGALPPSGTASPRRFHLSRFDSPDRAPGRGPKRSRFASALFIERSGKRKKTADQSPAMQAETPDIEMGDAPAPVQKRPGSKARVAPTAPATRPAPRLPLSLQNRQYDTSTEALSREMDSWALEHITQTLAKQEDERARQAHAHTTPTKYRPKAPAKRFAERHPEVIAPPNGDRDIRRDGDSETDDEDYVMETYVRVPAHTLEAPVPPEQLGVLVFDQGSDVEYFYGLEDDSEDEFLEDEEDSNGMEFPSLLSSTASSPHLFSCSLSTTSEHDCTKLN